MLAINYATNLPRLSLPSYLRRELLVVVVLIMTIIIIIIDIFHSFTPTKVEDKVGIQITSESIYLSI